MALDVRKMRFYQGRVLTQKEWDEIQRSMPKYKINPTTLLAMTLGLCAGTDLRR